MKKTLFKEIKKTLRLLLYGMLGSFIFLVFFILCTKKGFDLTINFFEKNTHGRFKFTGATGTLIRSIHVKKIAFSNPHQTIVLENVTFKWNPLALLQWHLQIENFSSQKVLITQKPVKTSQRIIKQAIQPIQLTLPRLPIYLVIQQLNVDEIKVVSENKTAFYAKALQGNIAITRTQLTAHLQSQLKFPFPMQSRLDLSGNASHYAVRLSLSGKGFDWKLAGQGDKMHFVFNTLQDELFKGKLNLSGWIKSPEFEINTQPSSVLSPQIIQQPKKEENLLHWAFSLTASNLRPYKISPVLINGTLTGKGEDTIGRLSLKLTDSRYYQPISGQAALRFNYPFIQNFNAEFYSGKNTLSIHGNLFKKWVIHWKAYIENLKLFNPKLEGKLLTQGKISGKREKPEVNAHFSADNLKIDHFSIKNFTSSAFFNMESPDNSQITLNAQQINIGPYNLSNITLNGNLKENIEGTRVNFQLKPGTFQYPFENKIQTESFSGGTWETRIFPRKIVTYLDVHLIGKSHLQGEFTLPKQIKNALNQKIKGSLKGEANHLDFISSLTSPTVRNIQGQLTMDVQMGGTLKKPDIKSFLTLKASAFLPVLNLHLKNIELKANGEKQIITYNGHAESENTLLKLTGETNFQSKDVLSEFHITSPDFLMTNTREIKIHTIPDIKIKSKNEKTTITGTVHIPHAEIAPLDFTNIVTLPEEVKYANQTSPTYTYSLSVESDILLILGNDVHLKYQGLTGYLTGEVRIKNKPLQPTIGIGEIKIKDGLYEVKGRKLTIHRGSLFFTGGPLANPGVQIQAARKIQVNNIGGIDPNMDFGANELVVGISATGSLRRHQVKLFSEPPGISQANIFSYLVTGQAGSAQGNPYSPLIMEAANTLGGGTTSTFAEKIKKGLGLTDITIQNSPVLVSQDSSKENKNAKDRLPREFKDRPALVLGKAISPVLYINYAITKLANPLSGLQARYQLTKHWLIQTAGIPGDKNASIDLIRSVESKD